MTNNGVQVFTSDKRGDFLKMHKGSSNGLIASALEKGLHRLASNFRTDEIAIAINGNTLLGTVNEKVYENSPIISPFNLFCLYPKKKLQFIKNSFLRGFLHVSTSCFSLAFKAAKFDQVIQLNNKPCDAITYPELSASEVQGCVSRLTEKFPGHAIIFPRIDPVTSSVLCSSLEASGFLMVPTRSVHIFLPNSGYMKKSHTKRDISLLKKGHYQIVNHSELTNEDLNRIYQLYKMLFIEKHGVENPALTMEFFESAHAHCWYTFFGIRSPEGVIEAFFSYETRGDIMACGPLGYDTSKDQAAGLYRMIFANSLLIADQNNYIFNFGGGNEHFKMNRGSKKVVGYTAVYCKHLPFYRRIPWQFLESAGKKVTVKILENATF